MPISPKSLAPTESGGNIVSIPKDNQVISSVSYDIFLEGEGTGQSEAIGFLTNILFLSMFCSS